MVIMRVIIMKMILKKYNNLLSKHFTLRKNMKDKEAELKEKI